MRAINNLQLAIYKKGFTMVELLIVIVTVAVLAVAAINLIDPVGQMQKGRDSQRKSDLAQMQKAIEKYRQDFGTYPVSTKDYKIKAQDSNNSVNWGRSWLPYMEILPKDPSSSRNYVYYSPAFSGGQTYYLYAGLEMDINDPEICHKDGSACDTLPLDTGCGKGVTCNYGVSSPNVSP